jgi:hypothetical protein
MPTSPEQFDPSQPLVTWLPLKKLSVIWIQSQRPFRDARAQKIADAFNIKRFDPVRVTLPNGNGEYHIVDGQHRRAAAEKVWGAEAPCPCIILPSDDPAEAARDFIGINTTRWNVDPVSDFKVRVTAKEKTYVAINRIVEHRGYYVGHNRSSGQSGRIISAVGALHAVYMQQGPKTLDEVLQVLSATWPSDPFATSATILRTYGRLLNQYGSKVNWGHLKEAVSKKYTPGSLLTHTKDIQHGMGGSMTDAMLKVVIALYNRGQPEKKKLDPDKREEIDET